MLLNQEEVVYYTDILYSALYSTLCFTENPEIMENMDKNVVHTCLPHKFSRISGNMIPLQIYYVFRFIKLSLLQVCPHDENPTERSGSRAEELNPLRLLCGHGQLSHQPRHTERTAQQKEDNSWSYVESHGRSCLL